MGGDIFYDKVTEIYSGKMSVELTVVRKTVIDGQTVLELITRSKESSKESVETWWGSAATWLPVRTLTVNSAESIQVDYGFLPPTPVNLARLKVTIPAGFTRTPSIQKSTRVRVGPHDLAVPRAWLLRDRGPALRGGHSARIR